MWTASLSNKRLVTTEGYHGAALQTCVPPSSKSLSQLTGSIAFHNPYGFLPAEYYGILPFQVSRLTLLALGTLLFSLLILLYRETLLPLHIGILLLFLVSLVDSITSLSAYLAINSSGTPDCCPYASPIITSLTISIFRQCTSRILLLVIALGYGIARATLPQTEWIMVAGLAGFYLTTSLFAEFSQIQFEHSNPFGNPNNSSTLNIALLFASIADMVFLLWIFNALNSTMQILTQYQQTYKLELYQRITNIMFGFTGIFFLVFLLLASNSTSFVTFPWQLSFLSLVLWDVVNVGLLCAIAFVCRPNENAKFLSYASQLPTSEEEIDGLEGGFGGLGHEGRMQEAFESSFLMPSIEEGNERDEETTVVLNPMGGTVN